MAIRAADPKLSVRVGAVMIPVLLASVAYFVFLRDKMFLRPSVTVRVYFVHVGNLREGAPVIVAGRQVGKVAAIQLLRQDMERPDDPLQGESGAVVVVKIYKSRRGMVPVNGDWFISARGIFGDRYLEVAPPKDNAEPGRPIENGDKLRGADPPSMDRVLQNTWRNLNIAREFLEQVEPAGKALFAAVDELAATLATLEPAPGEVAALRTHVAEVADQARATLAILEAGGARPGDISALAGRARAGLAQMGVSIGAVRARMTRLMDSLARVRDRLETARPGLERKIRTALLAADRAFAKVDDVRAKVQDLMGIIARGEGTIGKISSDPEFPEDAKELGKILKRAPWRVVGHPQDDLDP